MLNRWNYFVLLASCISFAVAGCSSATAPQADAVPDPVPEKATTSVKADSAEASKANADADIPDERKPDRILITVNGISLTYEQAQMLVQHGLGRNVTSVAQRWTDIQLKKREAKKRNIDKIGQNAFIVQLFADHYLGFRILHDEIRKSIPTPTEEDARNKYEQRIKHYQRPATFDIQHITIADKAEAEKIADDAKTQDADFNELVRRHSKARDKNRLGRIPRMTWERIQRQFGDTIANAIQNAKPDDILGPLPGLNDFEIIKVTSATPAETIAFEKVKERIIQQMKREAEQKALDSLLENLKANAKIEKSAELMELEKKDAEAAEASMPPPTRPNAAKPPARTAEPPKTPAKPARLTPKPKPASPKEEP